MNIIVNGCGHNEQIAFPPLVVEFGFYFGCGIALISDHNGHVVRSTPAFAASLFNPHHAELLLQFGCLGAITANGTSYLAPGNGSTQTNEITVRVPRAGILKNLHIQQRVASARPAAPISTRSA
jgi:hypothetical protein